MSDLKIIQHCNTVKRSLISLPWWWVWRGWVSLQGPDRKPGHDDGVEPATPGGGGGPEEEVAAGGGGRRRGRGLEGVVANTEREGGKRSSKFVFFRSIKPTLALSVFFCHKFKTLTFFACRLQEELLPCSRWPVFLLLCFLAVLSVLLMNYAVVCRISCNPLWGGERREGKNNELQQRERATKSLGRCELSSSSRNNGRNLHKKRFLFCQGH